MTDEPTVEALQQQLDSTTAELRLRDSQLKKATDDLAEVKQNFLDHKTTTQERLNQLSNEEGFSWEAYQELKERDAANVPRLAELESLYIALQDEHKNFKLSAQMALQSANQATTSLEEVMKQKDLELTALKDRVKQLELEATNEDQSKADVS